MYNTLHVGDTTFMLQVSSWVRAGDAPGVDFNHFYGGMHETFVALGLELSGGTVKALDYARLLEFGLVSVLFVLVAWKRLDFMTVNLLVLLCALTLFATLPFEERPFVLGSNVEAAHSFAYNRFGTVLSLLCATVLVRPSQHRSAEWSAGAIAGLAAMAAVFTKVTFFPIPLAMILGFALMLRWHALVAFLVAGSFFVLLLDPAGARTISVFLYSMESTGTGATESWLLRKAIRLVFSQHVEVVALLIGLGLVLFFPARTGASRSVWSAVVVLGAFWASSVTMGPAGLVGHQAVPFLVGLSVLLLPDIAQERARGAGLALSAVLFISFAGPHLLNTAGATYASIRSADEVALQEGPLAGYLARGPWRTYEDGGAISMRRDPERAVAATAERLVAGRGGDATTEYVLLINAVSLLDGIEVPQGYGVVSNTLLGIGFAAGADRADGFPAWPRASSPEFRDGSDPLRAASVMFLHRQNQGALTDTLNSFLSDAFILCRQSPLWDMYVRVSHSGGRCL
ncbi:hypothetical protein [Pseudophaeobacter sp.]